MSSRPQQLPKSLQKINNMADKLRSSMEEEASGSKPKGAKKGKDDFVNLSVNEISHGNLQELYTDLLEQYKKVIEEKEEISATAQRRQEAYLRKELKYREQLGSLEERINNINVDDPKGDIRMSHIRSMHGEIQDTIGMIQGKTTQILQAQERDLIRAFRARLADVTDELEKERKKNESGSVEWVQRCRKLTEELEWLRDLTDKLTAENKNYIKENRRFKQQLKTQEEDREFLIKQLVAVKKENARLRYSFEQAGVGGGMQGPSGLHHTQDLEKRQGTPDKKGRRGQRFSKTTPHALNSSSFRPASAEHTGNFPQSFGATTDNFDQSSEARYRSIINKTKRRADDLEHKLRSMKTAYTQEVGHRTELQNFLKKCIDDVKQDIAQRTKKRRAMARSGGGRLARASLPKKPEIDPRDIPLAEFTSTDRINVMEWLLSQDAVMFMLYDKMFPRRGSTQGSQLDGSMDYINPGMGMSSPSDFDNIGSSFASRGHASKAGPADDMLGEEEEETIDTHDLDRELGLDNRRVS